MADGGTIKCTALEPRIRDASHKKPVSLQCGQGKGASELANAFTGALVSYRVQSSPALLSGRYGQYMLTDTRRTTFTRNVDGGYEG